MRPGILVLAVAMLFAVVLVLLYFAPRCQPGAGGTRIGHVLVAGCP